MKKASYLLMVLSLVVSACGSSSGTSGYGTGTTGTTTSSSSLAVSSGHLVDGNGRTLYQDGTSTTACTTGSGCISAWPPYYVTAAPTAESGVTGAISTVVRSDGLGTQATYNGQPLYYFVDDTSPGEVSGNGQSGFSFVTP